MRLPLIYLLAAAVFLSPATSIAQSWLKNRGALEGPGIKLGDSFVFHPGIGIEGGFDSNPLRDSSETSKGVSSGGLMRIAPYLDLATRGKKRSENDTEQSTTADPKMSLRLGVATAYNQYFSSDEAVKAQRNFAVDSKVDWVLHPERNFSFSANAFYQRTLEPYESSYDQHARQVIKPGVGFRMRPGGGTLTLNLKYSFQYMFYEDPVVALRDDRISNDVEFTTAWKVFPKTAVLSVIQFMPINYNQDSDNNNSLPLRSMLGIQGLLTKSFAITLFGGYGASFYTAGPDFEGFIGRADLKFYASPSSKITVGFVRDFKDSLYANFYTRTGGHVAYRQSFKDRLFATLRGSLDYRGYAKDEGDIDTVPDAEDYRPSQDERSEVIAGLSIILEYRVNDWLVFHMTTDYQADITDFSYIYQGDGAGEDLPADYQKVIIMGGGRVQY